MGNFKKSLAMFYKGKISESNWAQLTQRTIITVTITVNNQLINWYSRVVFNIYGGYSF